MNNTEFNSVVEEVLNNCRNTLVRKAEEYATDEDRLHNFKIAANLQGVTVEEALGGMLAKHIVSIFDMIGANGAFVQEIWDEKIGDAINYLILLKAIVKDS